MTVFANSLEVSAKAQNCKVIAAFPDVCFTPPLTPATPPGVPIPYPNFGMDSDLASGSSTVKIGGKPVSQENASNYSKISGDEAGSAPKKSVITSKNMGKAYAKMWSMDVKADGKGVVRFSDIMTTNHASDTGATPPMPAVATANMSAAECAAVLIECGIHLHKHEDSPCTAPDQSEHMMQNALFQNTRGDSSGSIPGFEKYSAGGAPCICMEGPGNANAKTPCGRFSAHGQKTAAQRKFASDQAGVRPKVEDAVKNEMNSIKEHHPAISKNGKKGEEALECLEAVCYDYLEKCTGKSKDEVKKMETRVPWGPKIPKGVTETLETM